MVRALLRVGLRGRAARPYAQAIACACVFFWVAAPSTASLRDAPEVPVSPSTFSLRDAPLLPISAVAASTASLLDAPLTNVSAAAASTASLLDVPLLSPPVGFPLQPGQVAAQVDQWWSRYSGTVWAMLHTGDGAGMCTDYASGRRADIIERVEKLAATEHILTGQSGPVLVSWQAKDWAANARWGGLATGKKPRRGAVLVFQPGAYGAAKPGGHVAIVDRVNRNGSFRISEEHAPVAWVVSKRRLSARIARKMARDPQITFIY